jgi:ABC-type Na+ efflux pump permease subunit
MKINSNVISQIKYETIKLKDKETGKELSFEMKSDEMQKIEKRVSSVKSYLQAMFEQYQKDGNIDKNSDGYLDTTELITSKRFINAKVNSNLDINFSINSLQDIVKDDKKATQIMEDILKDEGNLDGKISINKDFLEYLAIDTNQEAVVSDKEIFNDM